MKMDKLFAGLIAFVAGVALSAGSAFATNGYTAGDTAMMKLVPYYETGDTTATIIGIQNMSPQQQDTQDKNLDVQDVKGFLALEGATANAVGLINAEFGGTPISAGKVLDPDTELNLKAAAEAALAKAEKAAYVEHLFIGVNVYDAMGAMMDNASASLCLAENQFGVVVLQGAAATMTEGNRMQVLSVTDEDIPANGYVQVVAEDQKFSGCDFSSRTNPPATVDTRTAAQLADQGTSKTTTGADSQVATWAIIQDTGMGFFGTEVPSATVTMMADDESTTDVDESKLTACYSTDTFDTAACGLIPERHDNSRFDDDSNPNTPSVPSPGIATPRATVTARYDAGDDSTVYVWLAAGGDTEKTKPSGRRMLEVTVVCEDGTKQMAADEDGNPGPIKVGAPGKLTMLDPVGEALSPYTDLCEGDRGVLEFKMPDSSNAGMAFTHIQQMTSHYRMNFPGYSTASTTPCTTAAGNCP